MKKKKDSKLKKIVRTIMLFLFYFIITRITVQLSLWAIAIFCLALAFILMFINEYVKAFFKDLLDKEKAAKLKEQSQSKEKNNNSTEINESE